MSSPLATEIGPKLPNRRRRSPIRAIIAVGIVVALILASVGILFASGILLITSGTLSPSLAQVPLYVARDGLDVTALRASDGAMLWRHLEGGWYTAASDGLIYTSSTDDAPVFALKASDGSRAWTAFAVGDVLAAGNGTVLVGRFDGVDPSHVEALNAADGSIRWNLSLDGSNRPNATLSGSTVYIYGAGVSGSFPASDELYAVRTSDGTVLWKATTSSTTSSPAPAVGDGAAYVLDDGGFVNAVSASDGSVLWRVKVGSQGSGPASSLATGQGAVFASSSNGDVVALSASGATLWHASVDPSSPPAFANGAVYVNTHGGDLVALNASNGAQLWRLTVHGQLATYGEPRPIVFDGAVFEGVSGYCTIFCRQAFVYGIRASDGAVAWRVQTAAEHTAYLAI